ncbi:CUN069 similar to AcMNPV ORF109 [Culex nigripalpus nucleopolyhedrovirus]|uniref:CUN069 similar to AcMNPV ORF109 n=1 Tax=Culex nigripalpus nucleopolyhedrovirus (isolate Florida/1997) TaxID=645993 RepID=Q919K7_NPVCO|nr:CUN069 similar to AcMNPV ORF109 [Culex nigripalpus nucleopolyhedrovirus]AAK94147.1 CUN069 similar to AcMNPV ORF109 [Culex nigripalpus nucleopolyhedrovirus]
MATCNSRTLIHVDDHYMVYASRPLENASRDDFKKGVEKIKDALQIVPGGAANPWLTKNSVMHTLIIVLPQLIDDEDRIRIAYPFLFKLTNADTLKRVVVDVRMESQNSKLGAPSGGVVVVYFNPLCKPRLEGDSMTLIFTGLVPEELVDCIDPSTRAWYKRSFGGACPHEIPQTANLMSLINLFGRNDSILSVNSRNLLASYDRFYTHDKFQLRLDPLSDIRFNVLALLRFYTLMPAKSAFQLCTTPEHRNAVCLRAFDDYVRREVVRMFTPASSGDNYMTRCAALHSDSMVELANIIRTFHPDTKMSNAVGDTLRWYSNLVTKFGVLPQVYLLLRDLDARDRNKAHVLQRWGSHLVIDCNGLRPRTIPTVSKVWAVNSNSNLVTEFQKSLGLSLPIYQCTTQPPFISC